MDFLRPRPWRTWPNLTSPSSANRTRHSLTDAGNTDNAWAIAVFAKPSAAINNARARTTSRCGADDDRATVSRTSRCPGDTNRAGTGGRIPGSIPLTINQLRDTPLVGKAFRRHDAHADRRCLSGTYTCQEVIGRQHSAVRATQPAPCTK